MSNCCSSNKSTSKKGPLLPCLKCKIKGKHVPTVTLESLLSTEALPKLDKKIDWQFCATSDCSIVYYSQDTEIIFTTDDLTVPVHQKANDPSVKACYCFDHTPNSIRQELEETGTTTALERIKADMKGPGCRCEITNPQGTCCLGNVSKVIKLFQQKR